MTTAKFAIAPAEFEIVLVSDGQVMIWANVPSIAHDQALAQQLRLEVPVLNIQTNQGSHVGLNQASNTEDERPMTASVEMEEWLKSPISEVICR
ncbi:hypothetical protein BGZ59_010929 [Podila verticillata]|nr:hypothetical protein BGZ59_010929 [Podila verticillata]